MNNKALINNISVAGRLYSINMTEREVQNKESKVYGTKFYNGTISVATDDDCLNIVEFHFSYLPEGRPSYPIVAQLVSENRTVETVGKENATLVSVRGQFENNDFYSARSEEVVASVRLSGSFVNIISSIPKDNNKFEAALLYQRYILPEDEGDTKIRGALFSFRGELIPTVFTFKPEDISYWEGLNDGELHVIRINGYIDMCNIEMTQETEGVFGPIVKTITRRKKDYVITNVAVDELVVGEDGVITRAEIEQASKDREVHLASVKTEYDAYQAKKNAASAAPASIGGIKNSDFGF